MDGQPQHKQLPLKQLLVLGLVGVSLLAFLMSAANHRSPLTQTPVDDSRPTLPPLITFTPFPTLTQILDPTLPPPPATLRPFPTPMVLPTLPPGTLAPESMATLPPPPTLTPSSSPTPTHTNFALGSVEVIPALPLQCGRTAEFRIDISNLGTEANRLGGQIVVTDFWQGQEQESASGAFPIIEAGEMFTASSIFLTVSNHPEEAHMLRITINPYGGQPEMTMADNSREFPYTLQPC